MLLHPIVTIANAATTATNDLDELQHSRSSSITLESNTLDSVLQLLCAGSMAKLEHAGGLNGLLIPRTIVVNRETGAAVPGWVLSKKSARIKIVYMVENQVGDNPGTCRVTAATDDPEDA